MAGMLVYHLGHNLVSEMAQTMVFLMDEHYELTRAALMEKHLGREKAPLTVKMKGRRMALTKG